MRALWHAFCAGRLSCLAFGREWVAASDASSTDRATARSGVTPPSAPDIPMMSALTFATSAEEALGSQCVACGPSLDMTQPCEDPSVTTNPGQLKVFEDRLHFHRNSPPARGLRYRYKCPACARRPWGLDPPALADGMIVGSIFYIYAEYPNFELTPEI